MFIHTVHFWLTDGASAAMRDELLRDCRELLSQIPGVRHLWAGVPVPSERSVVDGTYDVGLCVIFDDKAGHDVYQPHPLHERFISRNKGHWAKVQVRDFTG